MIRFMLLIVFWLFAGGAFAKEVVYSTHTGIEIAGKQHSAHRFLFKTPEASPVKNLLTLLLLKKNQDSRWLLVAKSVDNVCGAFPNSVEPRGESSGIGNKLTGIERLPKITDWLSDKVPSKQDLKKTLEKAGLEWKGGKFVLEKTKYGSCKDFAQKVLNGCTTFIPWEKMVTSLNEGETAEGEDKAKAREEDTGKTKEDSDESDQSKDQDDGSRYEGQEGKKEEPESAKKNIEGQENKNKAFKDQKADSQWLSFLSSSNVIVNGIYIFAAVILISFLFWLLYSMFRGKQAPSQSISVDHLQTKPKSRGWVERLHWPWFRIYRRQDGLADQSGGVHTPPPDSDLKKKKSKGHVRIEPKSGERAERLQLPDQLVINLAESLTSPGDKLICEIRRVTSTGKEAGEWNAGTSHTALQRLFEKSKRHARIFFESRVELVDRPIDRVVKALTSYARHVPTQEEKQQDPTKSNTGHERQGTSVENADQIVHPTYSDSGSGRSQLRDSAHGDQRQIPRSTDPNTRRNQEHLTGPNDRLRHDGAAGGEKSLSSNSPQGTEEAGVITHGISSWIVEAQTNINNQRDELNRCLINVENHYANHNRIKGLSPTDIDGAVALAESIEQLTPPLAKTLGVIGTASANLLDHARERLDRMDAELRDLHRNNQSLTRFTAARLTETGFLAPNMHEPEKVDKAMEAYGKDIEERPENLEYVRCLIDLRKYLHREAVRNLPYYRPSGLERLRTGLEKKERDWQSLFNRSEEEIVDGLIGHWNEFLQDLYRSALLLKTYWPEDTDQSLRDRLSRSQSAVRFLLNKYGIRPHEISLLKPETEVLETGRILSDDNVPIPEVFSETRAYRSAADSVIGKSGEGDRVAVYVHYWGFDCSAPGQDGKSTTLISRSRESGLS